MTNKLLTLRNKMKSEKPEFERQDSNKYPQFEGQWRRPRGIHSKLRKNLKGHKARPEIGYSSPSQVKGLSRNGLMHVIVNNIKELNRLDARHEIIISGAIGLKNRLSLLNKIKEKNLNVLNIKNVDEFLNKAKEEFERKIKERKSNKDKRTKVKEEKEKKKSDDK